jgi:large subunit ribosomal protein L16
MINVSFGEYGLQALEPGRVSSRQIEAGRRAIAHSLQRGGKVWIRIFPHFPMTTHGSEMPMGKGKGAVDGYVAVVRTGTVMFEVAGVTQVLAKRALQLAGHKLCVRTQIISRI